MLDWLANMRMPGRSFRGDLPPVGPEINELSRELRRDVVKLSIEIGERHVDRPEALEAAAAMVETGLIEGGCSVRRQAYKVAGRTCHNVIGEIAGGPGVVVVGAHYDSIPGCPAANDNGSGVAALLALARRLSGVERLRTLRLVGFVNEEPPFFQTSQMGSRVYARECRQAGDDVVGMISLETIGYYTDEEGSQQYPFPLSVVYPSVGNFIAFVGDDGSAPWVHELVGRFRQRVQFPSEGAALPRSLPGVDWSDHWSFREEGYPALMITDTAPYRYPHYHTPDDTADKLDYGRTARVVSGMAEVLEELCSTERPPGMRER